MADIPKLSVEHVSVRYAHGQNEVLAVEDVTFSVGPEEFVCILGPSGCGKSTILHLLAGFIKPTSGEVYLDGFPIRKPGPDRGVVFQQYSLFPWKTVFANIAFGPRMRGLTKQEQHKIVHQYLDLMDLSGIADSYPAQLSVGMQQRVALARTYANNLSVLLMDEPFASLDSQTGMSMRELLSCIWSDDKRTVVFVTHDIDEALLLGDRLLILSPRPGHVKRELHVKLPRPRSHDMFADARYLAIRKAVADCVMGTEARYVCRPLHPEHAVHERGVRTTPVEGHRSHERSG